MNITLRPATLDDVELLMFWDTQPHVISCRSDTGEIDPNLNWNSELTNTDPYQKYVIAELDNRPIGVMQIIDPALESTHYWGKIEENLRAIDIWIGEAGDLGKGYGTCMMKLALGDCFADPRVIAVIIDPLASNTRAIKFYQNIGFKFVKFHDFDEDKCAIYRLNRADWEKVS